jgi:hypothetical protein
MDFVGLVNQSDTHDPSSFCLVKPNNQWIARINMRKQIYIGMPEQGDFYRMRVRRLRSAPSPVFSMQHKLGRGHHIGGSVRPPNISMDNATTRSTACHRLRLCIQSVTCPLDSVAYGALGYCRGCSVLRPNVLNIMISSTLVDTQRPAA